MNPLKRYLSGQERGAKSRLAQAVKCSRNRLADIESGRRAPTLDLMRRLDAATDGAVAFADWKEPHAANPPEGSPHPPASLLAAE